MKTLFLFAFSILSLQTSAQDLLDILDQETTPTKDYISSTFKGTRILNGHSVENRKKKALEFVISHRFGRINLGLDELYGLDQSNIRFAFEYGLSDRLMVGLGRSSYEKTFDSFFKYKLLRQSTGENAFPVTVSLFGSIANKTAKDYNPANKPATIERLFYTSQLLIAKKVNSNLSLQITPTYIHRNSAKTNADPHDILALGFGGRIKLNKRVSFNGEYFHSFNPLQSFDTTNSLAFGIDIETGGHVFQIILSNSITMIEKSFITETTDNFFNGDIHLGFNISRTFETGKHK